MPKLYSYCISYDTGAAPNPFWDICTLVICKPVIRRKAEVGDWIVGTRSTSYGFQNQVVYAMQVTQKMTMAGYDDFCKEELPAKMPSEGGYGYKNRVGDCIYDFSINPPRVRGLVHNEGNRQTDLSGEYALLSDHFYYFGEKPVDLPAELLGIVKQGQGHKSTANALYLDPFVLWITNQHHSERNKVINEPYLRHWFIDTKDCLSKCAVKDKELNEEDEALEITGVSCHNNPC